MRASFLLWCQNSLRQTTPRNDAFSVMKKIYLAYLADQNDRQNLSFVKDIYVVGIKMTKNGHKMAKLKSIIF